MNDIYFEKCGQCAHGELVRDNHDEFYLCKVHKSPTQCDGDKVAVRSVKLIAHTPNPMAVIEKAASMCYNSKPTNSGRIAKSCYNSGHTSVFEHATFTFEITGVSRAFLAQITRHRIASFSVRSQRYCVEDGFKSVWPTEFINNPLMATQYARALENSQYAYDLLREIGAEPEDARSVLPNACETRMVVTMNARELMSFCGLRLCTRAQWEIRKVAQMMVECVREVAPDIAEFLRPNCERYAPYNFCTERESCGRHPTLAEVFEKRE